VGGLPALGDLAIAMVIYDTSPDWKIDEFSGKNSNFSLENVFCLWII
jgi:hypothetical protein